MFADWQFAPPAPAAYFAALSEFRRVTVQTLYARGWRDPTVARGLLAGAFERAHPEAMRGMSNAVARINAAIDAGEPVAIYGDYDCDGVTSCALLATTLRALGVVPRVYIPDRFEEGYGLNAAALDTLADEGMRLVVTVDCGARAVAEAHHAQERGLDLIITDHHELGESTPDALVFINPHHPECAYPFKFLAGVGVAFRLAQCLLRSARQRGRTVLVSEGDLLDFVAIGTVADVVALTGENRALVRAGLERINAQPRPGLRALMRAAGVTPGRVDAGRIGFALAPRLNAAGRLGSARAAYELLMAEDDAQAEALAEELSQLNTQRQSVTASVAADAEQRALAASMDVPLLFAADEEYNAGVIGLAAARLAERHRRPAVVVSLQGDEARGSCRSVTGFHITAALDRCADLLTRHGGHAAAAGFTLPRGNVDALAERLVACAADLRPAEGWRRALDVDAVVRLSDLDWSLKRELALLEPHGAAHPRPLLLVQGVQVLRVRSVGSAAAANARHLQLRLQDERGRSWDAICWRAGERASEFGAGAHLDLTFHLIEDEFAGEARLQLEIVEFRAAV